MNTVTSASSVIQKAIASAPGKAILFGEHAVVYGTTAAAGSLSDMRIFVEASTVLGERQISICFKDIKDAATGDPTESVITFDSLTSILSSDADPCGAFPPNEDERSRLRDAFNAQSRSEVASGMMCAAYLVLKLFSGNLLSAADIFSDVGLHITVKSHGLPIGAGLGSSAAFSVALSAALLHLSAKLTLSLMASGGSASASQRTLLTLFGLSELADSITGEIGKLSQAENDGEDKSLALINAWAYACEVLIHGSPSGLDNTTSCFGGLVKFSKDGGFENISDVPQLHILLVNTKVPRSTKHLVAGVRTLRDTYPTIVDPIIDNINSIALKFFDLIGGYKKSVEAAGEPIASDNLGPIASIAYTNCVKNIGDLMKINHHLLCALGVGHSALSAVVESAAAGDLPCKLTGAGGGGCAIILSPVPFPDPHVSFSSSSDIENSPIRADLESGMIEAMKALRNLGYELHRTSIGGDGVRLYI